MSSDLKYISTELQDHVGVVEFSNPPHNHLNVELITELLDSLRTFDETKQCRAIVVASIGRVFCAGGDFGRGEAGSDAHIELAGQLYAKGMEIFNVTKPMIAAVDGAAVGGGLGLALAADFRITCKEAKFCANFSRLGMHPGFGVSYTLPKLVGTQFAQLMFFTGRRISGTQAVEVGLADFLVDQPLVKEQAIQFAHEIASSAPLAVMDTRATLRQGLAEKIRTANLRELDIQIRHMRTNDFKEGLISTFERREPTFKGD